MTLIAPYPQKFEKLQAILSLLWGLSIFLIFVPAVMTWLYGIVAYIKTIINWFRMLFGGGKYPQEDHEWMRKWMTQLARVQCFMMVLTDVKPPTSYDGGQHPVELQIGYPPKIGIVQLLVAWVFTIVPMIVAYFYGIYVGIMWLIGIFGVIFGGQMSESTHALVKKYVQQMMRIFAFMFFLTDQKPPIMPEDAP